MQKHVWFTGQNAETSRFALQIQGGRGRGAEVKAVQQRQGQKLRFLIASWVLPLHTRQYFKPADNAAPSFGNAGIENKINTFSSLFLQLFLEILLEFNYLKNN